MPESAASSERAWSPEAFLSLDSMEGLYEPPVVAREKERPALAAAPGRGYASVAVITALAYGIHYLPFAPFQVMTEHGVRRAISASILAMVLGVAARSFHAVPDGTLEQCKRLVKRFLPALIVLTGAGLDLAKMTVIGAKAFGITVACIVVSCVSAVWLGRLFRVWPKTALLIGTGTAICGTSAIVAAAPLIDAEDEDITLAVGTVNVLGLALMLCFPLLGGLLHLSDGAFGVWAGVSIHAVPQVVAAGFAYSEQAGALATLVKLVRVTLLAPFLIALMFWYARSHAGAGKRNVQVKLSRMVPPFLWGFLALALISTVQMLPTLHFHLASWMPERVRDFEIPVAGALVEGGNVLLTIVMAALGVEVNLRAMASVGRPALLTGLAACVVLCGVGLGLIWMLL